MTPPVSTVPAVSTYLVSAIEAQTNTDALPILVKLGETGTNNPNDVVTIGHIMRSAEPANFIGSGGAGWMDEVYDVVITAWSWAGSGDTDGENDIAIQLTDRAWQLAAYIETAVRDDPSLGELVNLAFPQVSQSPGAVWTEAPVGLLVQVDVTIHVEATI